MNRLVYQLIPYWGQADTPFSNPRAYPVHSEATPPSQMQGESQLRGEVSIQQQREITPLRTLLSLPSRTITALVSATRSIRTALGEPTPLEQNPSNSAPVTAALCFTAASPPCKWADRGLTNLWRRSKELSQDIQGLVDGNKKKPIEVETSYKLLLSDYCQYLADHGDEIIWLTGSDYKYGTPSEKNYRDFHSSLLTSLIFSRFRMGMLIKSDQHTVDFNDLKTDIAQYVYLNKVFLKVPCLEKQVKFDLLENFSMQLCRYLCIIREAYINSELPADKKKLIKDVLDSQDAIELFEYYDFLGCDESSFSERRGFFNYLLFRIGIAIEIDQQEHLESIMASITKNFPKMTDIEKKQYMIVFKSLISHRINQTVNIDEGFVLQASNCIKFIINLVVGEENISRAISELTEGGDFSLPLSKDLIERFKYKLIVEIENSTLLNKLGNEGANLCDELVNLFRYSGYHYHIGNISTPSARTFSHLDSEPVILSEAPKRKKFYTKFGLNVLFSSFRDMPFWKDDNVSSTDAHDFYETLPVAAVKKRTTILKPKENLQKLIDRANKLLKTSFEDADKLAGPSNSEESFRTEEHFLIEVENWKKDYEDYLDFDGKEKALLENPAKLLEIPMLRKYFQFHAIPQRLMARYYSKKISSSEDKEQDGGSVVFKIYTGYCKAIVKKSNSDIEKYDEHIKKAEGLFKEYAENKANEFLHMLRYMICRFKVDSQARGKGKKSSKLDLADNLLECFTQTMPGRNASLFDICHINVNEIIKTIEKIEDAFDHYHPGISAAIKNETLQKLYRAFFDTKLAGVSIFAFECFITTYQRKQNREGALSSYPYLVNCLYMAQNNPQTQGVVSVLEELNGLTVDAIKSTWEESLAIKENLWFKHACTPLRLIKALNCIYCKMAEKLPDTPDASQDNSKIKDSLTLLYSIESCVWYGFIGKHWYYWVHVEYPSLEQTMAELLQTIKKYSSKLRSCRSAIESQECQKQKAKVEACEAAYNALMSEIKEREKEKEKEKHIPITQSKLQIRPKSSHVAKPLSTLFETPKRDPVDEEKAPEWERKYVAAVQYIANQPDRAIFFLEQLIDQYPNHKQFKVKVHLALIEAINFKLDHVLGVSQQNEHIKLYIQDVNSALSKSEIKYPSVDVYDSMLRQVCQIASSLYECDLQSYIFKLKKNLSEYRLMVKDFPAGVDSESLSLLQEQCDKTRNLVESYKTSTELIKLAYAKRSELFTRRPPNTKSMAQKPTSQAFLWAKENMDHVSRALESLQEELP